jgi:hypothetical protein
MSDNKKLVAKIDLNDYNTFRELIEKILVSRVSTINDAL